MSDYKIFGGKVHVYGDLHLSNAYKGQHKDYDYECYVNMENIVKKVSNEKPSAVFFLGDIVGVTERNLKDRQFLSRVVLFFRTLNELTGGNVYSVKGNHDVGDFSDFDLLVTTGFLKNPDYVDYYGCSKSEYKGDESQLEVRFHFVNYGSEEKDLKLTNNDSSNVVLGHADYIIDGVTNWYKHKDSVNLARLVNFIGVDLVVSGHIHNPSDEVLTTTIKGEDTIGLVYLGSPSRTAERYDDCWYMKFEYVGGSTEYNLDFFGLEPADKVFYPKEDFINDIDEEELEAVKENESLTNIVKEIMELRMTSGDLFGQIKAVPHADERVKQIACDYLKRAMNEE